MSVLRDLSADQLGNLLGDGGLHLRIGPYAFCVRSPLPEVRSGLQALYGDFPLATHEGFADFHIALKPATGLLNFGRELGFFLDGQSQFGGIDKRHAYAFLEWGMNWCVSVIVNENLKLHAAVVAKDGVAMIMPGLPGSGKSTLCAALALSGWRVISDEHALVPIGTSCVVPICRPVGLKNESIPLIKAFSAKAVFGPTSEDTHKGVVAHMKSDLHPESHDTRPVPARLVVFPRYAEGEKLQLRRRTRSESFMFAAHHSFNYSLLSNMGFEAMTTLVDACRCYDLRYSDLDGALRAVEQLHKEVTAA